VTDTKRFDIFFTKSRRSIKIMKSSIWFLLFFCFLYIKGIPRGRPRSGLLIGPLRGPTHTSKGKAAERPSYGAAPRPLLI